MLYQTIFAQWGWAGLLVFSLVFGLGLYAAVATVAYAYYFRWHRNRFVPDYCADRAQLRHAIGYKLANSGTDTRTLQHYLGHRSIEHTVRYSELAADRFAGLWHD